MGAPLARGMLYAGGAFGLGFVLGPIREFVLAPALGRLPAVLLELPVLLGCCWWLAGRLARPLGRGLAPQLAMGAAALTALLLAELALGAALRGWGLAGWLRHFTTAEGAAGGVAYLVFAALPALAGRTPGR